jgi:putative acetyltransferase
MPIHVRAFVPADTGEIMRLFHDTVHAVNIRDYSAEQVAAWAPEYMDEDLWRGSLVAHHTAVAEEDGQIVGFADWEENGHLDRFYVHKDRQGAGVGTALLDAIENDARAHGVTHFHTEASITARPFFERRGYVVLAEQQVTVRGMVFTNYRMAKRL